VTLCWLHIQDTLSSGQLQVLYSYKVDLSLYLLKHRGPGSSVGIANDYGLDGPGSNPVGNYLSVIDQD